MNTLSLLESQKMAQKYGIKFAQSKNAASEEELEKACAELGFPIAMKIVSSQISHKTDVGGVAINIESLTQAKKKFSEMKKLEGFEAIALQKMLRGKEIIIGGKRDVQFGPTVLVGLGGIFVEVFKDYRIGICPIKRTEAKEMLESLKAYPVLAGVRGKKGVNLREVEDAIISISRLMMKEKKVQELDINPLIANSKNALAVDARIVVE
ncbi:MAG: acetate--CoA ligase family protein [archaeon]|nr:acetate--CoA ligase family protein [archaeon]